MGGAFGEDDLRIGGVVPDAHSGRWKSLWGLGGWLRDVEVCGLAADGFDLGQRDGSGAVDGHCGGVKDGGFETDHGGATVEDGADATVEVCEDVGGSRGADVAEGVGAGGGDGKTGEAKEAEGYRVGGNTDAYEGASGGDSVRDACAAWKKEGERAGPEGADEGVDAGCQGEGDLSECRKLRRVGDVDDERVPGGALLGDEDAGYGVGVESVGAKAVDGFRGEGYGFSGSQDRGGAGHVGGIVRVEAEGSRHMFMVPAGGSYTAAMHGAEIELKFPVPDPEAFRRTVEGLDFRLQTERTLERNTLYDTPDRKVRERGQIVRLRTYGKRCTLTHKRHAPDSESDSRFKTRIETESDVSDCEALAEIFAQLGYDPVFKYDKFRTEWASKSSDGHLVVDETPIGNWAELEGEPAWIDAMLQQLGIPAEVCTTASYGRLFIQWKERTGSPVERMTFEDVGLVLV